jgi:uncharacterized protein (DUF2141 family)
MDTMTTLLWILSVAWAAETTCTLTVTLDSLEHTQGTIELSVFTQADGFPTQVDKAFRHTSGRIQPGPSFTHTFGQLPCGKRYAVSAHHDENENKKLDTKWFVLPREPVGASNDARGTMGPPSFEDASMPLAADTSLHIQMTRL